MTEYVTVWVDDLPDLKRGEEIVRCRDCACAVVTHPLNPITGVPAGIEYWRCEHFWNADELCEVEPDGFCAWGERNDGSAPKNDVSDAEVDVTTDSREKLEADVHALCVELQDHHGVDAVDVWCGSDEQNIFERILLMLDRQASITEREILSHPDERDEQIAELQQQVDDLRDEWHRVCAERANLARDLGECMADRDRYRALCGQMLDAAHEIRRIADANMPEGAAI